MESNLNRKRLNLYLIFAFSISWLTAGYIYLNGGLQDSPEIVPNSGITLAVVLLASIYMWGPALANLLTRLITKEKWNDLFLKVDPKRDWSFWLAGWFGPGILSILGAVIFFLIFPNLYDSGFSVLKAQLQGSGMEAYLDNPFGLIVKQTFFALLIAPILNMTSTFGEEFGWRGYLVPKLSTLGKRKALIISGLIWGVWHWPVILMGHNYGMDYWGYPWLGLIATLWVMTSFGVLFGWLSQKTESVWPAVFAHGALNGIAALGMLFVLEPYPIILGPSPAGIIGCLPFTIISLYLLLKMTD